MIAPSKRISDVTAPTITGITTPNSCKQRTLFDRLRRQLGQHVHSSLYELLLDIRDVTDVLTAARNGSDVMQHLEHDCTHKEEPVASLSRGEIFEDDADEELEHAQNAHPLAQRSLTTQMLRQFQQNRSKTILQNVKSACVKKTQHIDIWY